jgi:hypothetical protein
MRYVRSDGWRRDVQAFRAGVASVLTRAQARAWGMWARFRIYPCSMSSMCVSVKTTKRKSRARVSRESSVAGLGRIQHQYKGTNSLRQLRHAHE